MAELLDLRFDLRPSKIEDLEAAHCQCEFLWSR